MPFLDSLDIANMSCQLLGIPRILSSSEDSKANSSLAFAYDKLRSPELRRNIWRFSIRRAVLRAIDGNTRELVPQPWSVATTYLPGAIVADANGDLWFSSATDNVGHQPGVSPVWEQYFGPMSVMLYDSTTAYYLGELVYKIVGNGGFVVYRSLLNGNTDDPGTTSPWTSTTTYDLDDVVSYSGSQWRSLIALNLNNTPAVAPNNFDVTVTYVIGNTVVASDGYIYTSTTNGNVGNDPTKDGGVHWTTAGIPAAWSKTPTLYPSTQNWLPVYAGLARLDAPYAVGGAPITTGGTAITSFKNVFRLPANWLREAPQEPKQGAWSVLGGPSGAWYSDYEYEGDFLLSTLIGPMLYRFVADVTVVSEMDEMFCTGLAARMAQDTATDLTQQDNKLQAAIARYNKVMGEARLVNAIEQGPTEPPEDDWITARV